MKELYNRISECSKKDKASLEGFALYIAEESGEVSRRLNEDKDLKPKKSTETVPQECCDVIVAAVGLINKYNWSYEDMLSYLEKKTQKYERHMSCS